MQGEGYTENLYTIVYGPQAILTLDRFMTFLSAVL